MCTLLPHVRCCSYGVAHPQIMQLTHLLWPTFCCAAPIIQQCGGHNSRYAVYLACILQVLALTRMHALTFTLYIHIHIWTDLCLCVCGNEFASFKWAASDGCHSKTLLHFHSFALGPCTICCYCPSGLLAFFSRATRKYVAQLIAKCSLLVVCHTSSSYCVFSNLTKWPSSSIDPSTHFEN